MVAIRARGLIKRYARAEGASQMVLGPVDLDIASGQFVTLLGPSGCGKTTLLNILSGLDTEYEGEVRFTSRQGSRAKPNFSYMFQESRLLPWLTVRDNLRFVVGRGGGGREVDARIDDWLGRVGLKDAAKLFPAQLSTGMQQRVSLVRALIVKPEVLFMDEPLSALDELTASQMRDELLSLWMEGQPTVVFVTHNPVEAVYLADRVLIMSKGPGRIVHDLDVREHLKRPRNPEDSRVWELSRECVRILRQPHEGKVQPAGLPG